MRGVKKRLIRQRLKISRFFFLLGIRSCLPQATCHWCHVMERESFEDQEVAELLNQHYIAIKVDREERPDIDHLYMGFCQALTGAGGWPLTILMTPEKQPFSLELISPSITAMAEPGC